jgi:phosphoribosyl 1,2-cyclic phosphodiesterase/ActR/RegA family two-component response regulator
MGAGRPLSVYIVEDSRTQADIARALLERAGHAVTVSSSSLDALREIPLRRPDCVLLDIMMPGMDGYEVCRRLRGLPELAATKLVIMSSKAYPIERKRAAEMGATGYFVKPLHPTEFVRDLERLVADTLVTTFWGVRGTLPISRDDSARYGGNTSCVSVSFPDGRLLIFDAGTGIKALSDALLAARRTRIEASILISHPHWDHLNALPFFAPLYGPGNQFDICGPSQGEISMRHQVSGQMDGVYFPITTREFAASVSYRDLGEGSFEIGGVPVQTILLRHPGNCLGYRFRHGARTICYVTDNELYPADSPFRSEEKVERLADFCREADLLITDCTYTDAEYPQRIHWGHSSVSQVVELAARARARRLCLFHHDPVHTDTLVDAKLAQARTELGARGAATEVIAPREYEALET